MKNNNDYLLHYGVKGMKWGIRNDPRVKSARKEYRSANKRYSKDYYRAHNYSARHPVTQFVKKTPMYSESNTRWEKAYDSAKKVDIAKKNYEKVKNQVKTEKHLKKEFKKNWYTSHNKAADSFNKKLGEVNSKYKNVKFDKNYSSKIGQQYIKEVDNLWRTEYKKALKQDYGKNAKLFVDNAPFMNQYSDFIRKK